MVVAVETKPDIAFLISALKDEEGLLCNSLDSLRGNRNKVKEYRAIDKQLQSLLQRLKGMEAFAQLTVGMVVNKPSTTSSGIITELRITPGGLPEAWVSWDGGLTVPERPLNLLQSTKCDHKFVGIWLANGTLIERCECGYTQPPTPQTLESQLDSIRQVRADYAGKITDCKPQTFVEAVERIDAQIKWLEEHLKQPASLGCETPAQDFGGNRHTYNSVAPPGNSSVAAPAFQNPGDEQLLPTPEIQQRLIDISTGDPCNTRLLSPEDDKAHRVSDSELVDVSNNEYLALEFIAINGGTQSRACLQDSTVDEYAEAMDDGAEFPPILVFYDGEKYWLADGFHRVAAAKKLEWGEITATIRSGTRRDAVLYSVGANATHGLRRTNADKRRAVLTLLGDEEWSQWSNREIAKKCGVSPGFVDKLRVSTELSAYCRQIESDEVSAYDRQIERTVTRNGTTYTMDTTKIGKNEVVSLQDEGDDSTELSVPEFDAKEARMGKEFNTVDKDQREPIPNLLPLTSDEITVSVVGNVDILSNEQLDAIVKAIEVEQQKRLNRL